MNLKKLYWMTIIATWGSFFYPHERAFSSDVYFANREIKKQIVSAIEGCRDSIDIAVSDITAHDFLAALVKAQKRGVTIRMVVGKKPAFMKESLPAIDKDGKVVIKVLSQKGRRQNNFVIFDSQLLAIGSYPWRKNASNYNRYDLIITDETKLVVKYQREFDRLFQEERTASGGVNAVIEEKKKEKPADTDTSDIIPKGMDAINQTVAPNYKALLPETPDGLIAMSFEDFDKVFGIASELSDEQKERLWSRCEGKRVKWNGKVAYLGWGLITGWMMNVKYEDTGVEVKLSSAHKDHFSQVKFGNTVTYTGKLTARVTRIFPYKLEDGDVLHIENTLPQPVRDSELVEDPYTVPVSQGPKKIFLVESFEDLDSIFGKESKVSEAQKEIAWGKYKGKYVSWMGQIMCKNVNVATGLRMGMTQKTKGDVEVKISLAKKDKVLKFHDGETILYTGKLVERCGDSTPYILEDGDIMTTKESSMGIGGM
ncbi:MAG: hypothetical protein DCC43_04750 [Candidatus Brocadia sp.]|nr:hypothetical protein [Candidatus Brocadia fulgida]MCC6324976.1 hypothetical protein [Candidatus Brocadia sp.]MCE7910713.1 hypothetical protein [Candidatus Brocadia sp. AMX3]MDG5996387.1 hypothetical protein [Candidatus Brocadia sp.]RIK02000.1 MAG: hypothetical protein DCC43_04750 [Candidatus Brocadia sp.]